MICWLNGNGDLDGEDEALVNASNSLGREYTPTEISALIISSPSMKNEDYHTCSCCTVPATQTPERSFWHCSLSELQFSCFPNSSSAIALLRLVSQSSAEMYIVQHVTILFPWQRDIHPLLTSPSQLPGSKLFLKLHPKVLAVGHDARLLAPRTPALRRRSGLAVCRRRRGRPARRAVCVAFCRRLDGCHCGRSCQHKQKQRGRFKILQAEEWPDRIQRGRNKDHRCGIRARTFLHPVPHLLRIEAADGDILVLYGAGRRRAGAGSGAGITSSRRSGRGGGRAGGTVCPRIWLRRWRLRLRGHGGMLELALGAGCAVSNGRQCGRGRALARDGGRNAGPAV